MTALEKFRESHPDADLEDAIFWTCPYDFGLEPVGDKLCGEMELIQEDRCRRCWEREVQG